MTHFSSWLEATWISKSLFGLSWLWPACESLHFVGLCLLIGAAGLLDLRLMGLLRGVAIRDVKAFMPWAIAGFSVNVATGLLFLIMQPHLYLSSVVWWSKVAFFGVAGLNALFFETRLSHRALALAPDADMPPALKIGGRAVAVQLVCGALLRTHAPVSRHRQLDAGS